MSTHVFFCHGSEDKDLVEQVFLKLSDKYPDIKGWLDKYEVVAGNDLIEKIHAGIEGADKFLVFFSERSIEKPWVKTEFRKALMNEISGVKPEFIIPVKLGAIAQCPPFLESKRYIDLENMTEAEWLSELYASITGGSVKKPDGPRQNLVVDVTVATDSPNAIIVAFSTAGWAEEIGFAIDLNKPYQQAVWNLIGLNGMHNISLSERRSAQHYSVAIPSHRITAKRLTFTMGFLFSEPQDPKTIIAKIDKWNGSGGTHSSNFMEYK